ncbi:MAG: metallophosphoesterase [Actinobacteria bacterium]|nr:metallophosphoesterase [Actinomycetota bacterium]
MSTTVRIAAAGDIHCAEPLRDRLTHAFQVAGEQADLVLLAGDLTTHGDPEQAAVLADICRDLPIPVVAVLGNHDYHLNRCEEVVAVLREAGVVVLQHEVSLHEVGELEVGIVGAKGFVGGFPGAELPDFGEPLLREVYAETTREVEAIEAGLEAISGCHRRIVLLHYAPIPETLVGEPETIWAFLGSSRLAAPIGAHRPDLVLHGHAHRGSFEGSLGPVPVRNVAVHVTGKDFELFEL